MSVLPAFTSCMRLIIFDSRNSSVGRALDWRSKGPWFNPGFRHPAVVTFYVIILLFDQCSLPTFRISQQLIWTWLLYTEETTTPPTFLVVCIPFEQHLRVFYCYMAFTEKGVTVRIVGQGTIKAHFNWHVHLSETFKKISNNCLFFTYHSWVVGSDIQ